MYQSSVSLFFSHIQQKQMVGQDVRLSISEFALQARNRHATLPFQLAIQVPSNTKKTVLDAVNGYYSVILDEESQKLTTFITEWGRFMYLRIPLGYLASGDA